MYDMTKDPYTSSSSDTPALKLKVLAAGDGDYTKALRVYAATAGSIEVLPIENVDGQTVTLEFPEGVFYEPTAIRGLVAITGTLTVHGVLK